MNTSQSPPGVYLMMLPPVPLPATKFEKKNAFSLATQVGPSFHEYWKSKFWQTFLVDTTIGAGNGPSGQRPAAFPPPPPAPAAPPAKLPACPPAPELFAAPLVPTLPPPSLRPPEAPLPPAPPEGPPPALPPPLPPVPALA